MLTTTFCLVPAFASDLQKRLRTEEDEPESAAALLAEVRKQVSVLERYADKANHGMHGDDDMEREGTNLWNLCTRLNRELADKTAKGSVSSKLVLASRVLSYQILHLCQWSTKSQARIACHLMRIALKAARVCTGACSSLLFWIRDMICMTDFAAGPHRRWPRRSDCQIRPAEGRRLPRAIARAVSNT